MRNNIIILITLFCTLSLVSCNDTDTYQTRMEKERNLRTAYLRKEGITKQIDGVSYQILKNSTNSKAQQVKIGDKIKVFYTGFFLDGRIFDNNVIAGKYEPIIISIVGERLGYIIKNGQVSGKVINGWIPGLLQMKEGMQQRIVVPSSMAYGIRGNSGIPSFTTLVFDLEVAEIISSQDDNK